ncbi:MAG: hypothetical protein ACLT9P_06090 [Evtepia gabavorous]
MERFEAALIARGPGGGGLPPGCGPPAPNGPGHPPPPKEKYQAQRRLLPD